MSAPAALERPAAPGASEDLFAAALRADARLADADRPTVPAPPRARVSDDPDAPHGRDDEGKPLAPYGFVNGTERPRLKPAGPGRAGKKDQPRTKTPGKAEAAAAASSSSSSKPAAVPDYSAELAGFGETVWMVGSSIKGGRIPIVKIGVPDLRAYAKVWHDELPQGVAVWNSAAQQNATVRGWVEKIAGGSSWAWVLGVGLWTSNLAAAFKEIAKRDNAAIRARLAELNDLEYAAYIKRLAEAAAAEAGPGPDVAAAAGAGQAGELAGAAA